MKEKKIAIEVELRGFTLKLSAIIESNVMSIIYWSNANQYKTPGAKYLKLKGLTFGKKVHRMKEVLNKYHPDLHEKNMKFFSDLDDFRKFRNLMAHCAFVWKDTESF